MPCTSDKYMYYYHHHVVPMFPSYIINFFILISLSTEPGKGKEERAAPQDSLHTEVKSECICMYTSVYLCIWMYTTYLHTCNGY